MRGSAEMGEGSLITQMMTKITTHTFLIYNKINIIFYA